MTDQEAKQTVRLTNIQRFSLHDGPGIRTTVFLKGCSLHCPWCANPENIRYEYEPWRKDDGSAGSYGYDVALSELKEELLKDRTFYLDGGGITFSGGEPLLQIERYEPLLRELREEHIRLAVETALFVPPKQVKIAAQYFDWWYVDMKMLVPEACRRVLGGDVRSYLDNLSWLAERKVALAVRIPCAHGITDTAENLEQIAYWIERQTIRKVEIFGVHDLAIDKYHSLGRKWTVDVSESEKAVLTVANMLEEQNVQYCVIKL